MSTWFCVASATRSALLWDWSLSVQEKIKLMGEGKHNPYWEFSDWANSLVFPQSFISACDGALGVELSHYAVTYARDLLLAWIVYYSVAGIWHYWIYVVKGNEYFDKTGMKRPSWSVIFDQVALAQAATFLYAALPVFADWLVENRFTRCYFYIEEIGGWGYYALSMVVYMCLVEVGVYWMHRELHEQKILYKYVHALHHKYNRPDTLSPWASIAFNPLDGILQASPYVFWLLFVPCHYLTHCALLFFTGVWATNIHDSVDGDTEPFMGAKYHTMHHTHYHCNFGQFTVVCDWLWGTLKVPSSRFAKRLD
jgi:lathosterol oxidase